jgi:small subunit ribosomal protein S13
VKIPNISKDRVKMLRIAGVIIPEKKRAVNALTVITGIGLSTSSKILKKFKISEDERFANIDPVTAEKIREVIEKENTIEGDLRVETTRNIKRLKDIGSYRGSRHAKGLPARGQRTKTNARTKRGKKTTVGSGRKKSAEKT